MALFDSSADMLLALFDWSALEHYNAALTLIGIPPADNERCRLAQGALHGIRIEHQLFHRRHPHTGDIRKAIEGIVAAALEIDRHLETLLAARISAPANAPERWAVLTALYPMILEILHPQVRSFSWDEREPGQAPMRKAFARAAGRIESAAKQLGIHSLEATNRPTDPAFDRTICRLAALYEAETGERAYSRSKGDQPEYRPPFAQFVRAFWPAIDNAPPSNDKIGEALSRRCESGQ